MEHQPDKRRSRELGSRTRGGQSLVDVLDRVLEKGLVVAGDIRVSLADVELLTIQIRLLVCSVDKAKEIGMDWWRTDPRLSSVGDGERPALESVSNRLDAIDQRLASLESEHLGDELTEEKSEKSEKS